MLLTVSNFKSLVLVELDNETEMYHSWAALFKVLVRFHDVYEHIIPPTDPVEVAACETSKAADLSLWRRLDVAIHQWIYGTISNNLLLAILLKDDTVQGAWSRLKSMFQDNKASRAAHLEDELTDHTFENFSSIDTYSTHIKSLADRLAEVDAPIPNSRLVLKLTGGLPEAYSGTVDFIQNQEPLPSFEICRSRLKLAELTIKNQLAIEGGAGNQNPVALLTVRPTPTTAMAIELQTQKNISKSKKPTNKPSRKNRAQYQNQQLSWPFAQQKGNFRKI